MRASYMALNNENPLERVVLCDKVELGLYSLGKELLVLTLSSVYSRAGSSSF